MRKTQRLDKILSNFGYGTRREIKQAVKDGIIKVDCAVAKDAGMHVNPENSVIEINGEALNYREYIYIMMNKPKGVISATYDPRHKTVVDLLPEEYLCFEPFPVGRLDIDTEGLLVMTNDGQLTHELLSPKKHVPKKYYAEIDGRVDETDVRSFENGVVLEDGYETMPASITILSQGDTSIIEVVIMEGKFHQVKRMFKAVGKEVRYLKRIEMGRLKLDGSLELGRCRELSVEELELLKGNNLE